MGLIETLTVEQLEKLNEGESVHLDGLDIDFELHPPCEKSEHQWSDPRVKTSEERGEYLSRVCHRCKEEQIADVETEELFS